MAIIMAMAVMASTDAKVMENTATVSMATANMAIMAPMVNTAATPTHIMATKKTTPSSANIFLLPSYIIHHDNRS